MSSRPRPPIQIRDFRPPEIPAGRISAFLALFAVAIVVWSCWFTVEPEEVGIVQRFGEYVREAQPGFNLKLPYPVETVRKVPVKRQLKEEFGFRTESVGVRSRFTTAGLEGESMMLTGDLNVADVEWTTQYKIIEPYKALFRVRNLTDTFRDMNEAVMRAVVGDRSVTEVLTVGRQEIASEVERQLQELCDQYETGLRIEQVVLQDVNPPEPVKPSFDEVNQAQQERERMINESRAQFNRVIPKARGEAEQTIQEAQGYAADRVNRAKGDASRFDSLRAAYAKAPEVTRRRIYLETMQKVMPKARRTLVLDDDLKGLVPLLSLDGPKGGTP